MSRRGVIGLAAVVAGAIAIAAISGCFRGEGMTPLMLAAHGGSLASLKRGIAEGEDVNARSSYGWTALMFASWKGHREHVVALLDAGADPNLVSGAVPSRFETVAGTPPTTALREAISNGHLDIARLLMSRGAKVEAGAAVAAAGKDDRALLEELDRRGVDWNEACPHMWHGTPLRAAAAAGNRKNIDWLLRHGANVNLVAGSPALKEAVDDDDPETVRFLLERGADPNLVYWSSDTVLFHATTKYVEDYHYKDNLEVIRLLLKHGADRNHRATSDKVTALELLHIQKSNSAKYLRDAKTPEIRARHEASDRHREAVMKLLDS
ncbi:ankyrin repeat domain-containing protein [Luteolibacter flavescens]|uniref:Ankyrin repeat domain-containing protein n=1 Tax=Luteolibacter flavescens TaxID=1859460 RepID=A0ABT3FUA1_9BACT|nr:ankyrin repeat domain-containing protein [Luteolibacter flavescens]MCW1887153.1 ankyrin repeat domain-containing protein [Luteolibacter flavescens]